MTAYPLRPTPTRRIMAIFLTVSMIFGEAGAQNVDKALTVNGVTIGTALNAAKMKSAGLPCTNSKNKVLLGFGTVALCEGSTSFLGENFHETVFISRNRNQRVIEFVTLCRDMRAENNNIQGISFEELERKLVDFYGMPDVLRTESPLQAIQYGADNVYGLQSGTNTWYFSKNMSVTYDMLTGHQEEANGPFIPSACVIFYKEKRPAEFDMPKNHFFPVMLKIASKWKNTPLEKGALVRLAFNESIPKTAYAVKCIIADDPPSKGGVDYFETSMLCDDGFQSLANPGNGRLGYKTQIYIFNGKNEVAAGYVNTVKASP